MRDAAAILALLLAMIDAMTGCGPYSGSSRSGHALPTIGRASRPATPVKPGTAHPGSPEAPTSAAIERDTKTLKRDLFTPDYHRVARMADGTVLLIFHTVCTGSADGHCQAVDVFRAGSTKSIWHRQYEGVLSVQAQKDGFAVKAVTYAVNDPLCCSSLPPVLDVYRWTGEGFTESGPLPRAPGG